MRKTQKGPRGHSPMRLHTQIDTIHQSPSRQTSSATICLPSNRDDRTRKNTLKLRSFDRRLWGVYSKEIEDAHNAWYGTRPSCKTWILITSTNAGNECLGDFSTVKADRIHTCPRSKDDADVDGRRSHRLAIRETRSMNYPGERDHSWLRIRCRWLLHIRFETAQ